MNAEQPHTALNILLADDDRDDRAFFENALLEIAIATHLTCVTDGEQLMEYLTENKRKLPDIVFLDLSMPRKTGFECLAEITGDKNFTSLYIVMLTTSFTRGMDLEDNLIKTLLNMGAHHYIRKPSDFEELKKIIKDILTIFIEKKPHSETPFKNIN
ncbi:response regulator [Ferruginibacter sp.]